MRCQILHLLFIKDYIYFDTLLVFWNINFNWALNYGNLNVKIEEMCINN